MGIPSYYKRLIDSVKGIVQKSHPGSIDWLWMDFNCMIYHCLRKPETPVYPGMKGLVKWEGEFIECIVKYLNSVVDKVNPSTGVFIGIDGVVPMAKMRQQRLRRFKSVWLTEHGLAEGVEPGQERWDTNAITPGTEFMSKLRVRLEKLCADRSGTVQWQLSSSDDPGEGEHKIMDLWRSGAYNGGMSHAVYGLDADLIVLSMLNGCRLGKLAKIWLFREEGDDKYCWLSIDILRKHIEDGLKDGKLGINDYCFAMSVLGNDFLPSSLSFKMRDDGHDELLTILRSMREPLISGGEVNRAGLCELVEALAYSEESRLENYIVRKMAEGRLYTGGLPVGDPNWPLAVKEEAVLVNSGGLRKDWKKIYYRKWLDGPIDTFCQEYLYGMNWIWSYYTGKVDMVCFNWSYSWSMPPLWSTLAWYLRKWGAINFPGTIAIQKEGIRPIEQLALVLPLQSWFLLGRNKERLLFEKAPWLFPKSFGFSSVGKRFFWECEPEIPVPTIVEVKYILA